MLFAERPAPVFWLSLSLVVAALALLSWQRLLALRDEEARSGRE
jgi:hypothetical protein